MFEIYLRFKLLCLRIVVFLASVAILLFPLKALACCRNADCSGSQVRVNIPPNNCGRVGYGGGVCVNNSESCDATLGGTGGSCPSGEVCRSLALPKFLCFD